MGMGCDTVPGLLPLLLGPLESCGVDMLPCAGVIEPCNGVIDPCTGVSDPCGVDAPLWGIAGTWKSPVRRFFLWGKYDAPGGLPYTLVERDSSSSRSTKTLSRSFSNTIPVDGGGSRMGDGARDGFAEWMLSVRRGPRKGLVDGV